MTLTRKRIWNARVKCSSDTMLKKKKKKSVSCFIRFPKFQMHTFAHEARQVDSERGFRSLNYRGANQYFWLGALLMFILKEEKGPFVLTE